MASIYGLFGSAIAYAAQGLSSNEFYRTIQAAGQGARRSEVLKLYAQAKTIVAGAETEAFANQNSVPSGNSLAPWPTRSRTGIRQNVKLLYRDKTTGDYKTTYWSTITTNGITRREAVSAAIEAYSGTADEYDQEFVGAFHSSAQLLTTGIM